MTTSTHDGLSIRGFYADARAAGDTRTTAARRAFDPRGQLEWLLRDAGWALIHAGDRVAGNEPDRPDADFQAGYRIGYRDGAREASVGPTFGLMREGVGLTVEAVAGYSGVDADLIDCWEAGQQGVDGATSDRLLHAIVDSLHGRWTA